MLVEALESVVAQTENPYFLTVSDWERKGAAHNRDAGLSQSTTEWTCFLDDDDLLKPHHVKLLHECAEDTKSDLCFPWFDVDGGTDPFPHWEGVPWDNDHPHQIPVTHIVRTAAALNVGGFSRDWNPEIDELDSEGNRMGEDYKYILRMIDEGYRITHLPERTWVWRHHMGNTSGRTDRW